MKPMTMLLEHGPASIGAMSWYGTLFLACRTATKRRESFGRAWADVNLRKRQTGATPLHAAVVGVLRTFVVYCATGDANIADESGAPCWPPSKRGPPRFSAKDS